MTQVVLFPDPEWEGWKSMRLYAHQLARWLPQIAPQWRFHMVRMPFSEEIVARTSEPVRDRSHSPRWTHLRPMRFLARYVLVPWHVARVRRAMPATLYHILDHSYAHLLSALQGQRTLITVHDLYPACLLQESVTLSPAAVKIGVRNLVLRRILAALSRARHLLADSEFTKREVQRVLGYPEERITVVPLGGDHLSFHRAEPQEMSQLVRRLGLPPEGRFLLHVGSCEKRKNIPTVLRAFALIRRQTGRDLYLVQVGGRFARSHWELIQQLGIGERVRQIGDLPDEQLALAYMRAEALLFPSVYEGFGLPVLEAMGAGTPVVAFDAGAIPEVLGEAGLLVSERTAEALAEAAVRVLTDEAWREQVVQRARERARAFTWQKTASRVLAVYRALAGEISGDRVGEGR